MASDLQRTVAAIQLNDYQTLIVLTAVGYDYILTFSKEVEYIWTKPWSRVSTLFVLVRYVGLCLIMGEFVLAWPHKDVRVHATPSGINDNPLQLNIAIGDALLTFQTWITFLFFGASDLVAILRVWALYQRSRRILAALLLLYAIELISLFILCATLSTGKFQSIGIVRVLDFSFCTRPDPSALWLNMMYSPQLVVGALMCVLVGVRFVLRSVQMYRATRQYRLDHYFDALVKEGVIYFVASLTYWVVATLAIATNIPAYEPWTVLLAAVQCVPIFTLTPRFILNLRELYARDLKPQLRSELDTGFGLTSHFDHGTAASAVANEGPGGPGQDEEIRMEERGVRSAGGGV